MIFVSGHPKSNSQNLSEHIVVMNEYSNFCEINNLIFLENNLISSLHKSGNINGYKSDCSGFSTHKYIQSTNNQTKNNISDLCLETNEKLKTDVSNTRECRIYAVNIFTSKQINRNSPPYFSIFLSLVSLFIIFKDKNNMFKKK